MRRLLILLLIMIGLLPVLSSRADQMSDLREDNQLLKDELQLARGGKLYVLVDMLEAEIRLKAGGIIVRRLKIDNSELVGERPVGKMRRLIAKKAFFQPKRWEVKVASESDKVSTVAGADTVTALEIDDMPTNYRLIFDDGTVLVVQAGGHGLTDVFGRVCRGLWGFGRRSLTGFYQKLRGRPQTVELFLTLAAAESRQLYWSFDEKTPCLIRNPSTY